MIKVNEKWAQFLAGLNTIVITNQKEYSSFAKQMKLSGVENQLGKEKGPAGWWSWYDLFKINQYHSYDIKTKQYGYQDVILIFEFQPTKGLTFCFSHTQTFQEAVDRCIQWYGQDPWRFREVFEHTPNTK